MATKINRFKEIASKELSLSPLMAGRDQLKTEDLAGKTATAIAFDFATITDDGEEKTFPVLLFKEYPDKYYNGGTILSKLCQAWADEFDGEVEHASAELEAAGGVQLRFKIGRTKGGRNITTIEVV